MVESGLTAADLLAATASDAVFDSAVVGWPGLSRDLPPGAWAAQ
ncbi:hypothetical protein QRX50_19325 [Amycolatopsis carbonis]|uniref:Uncharacterized protein n=1 Tax=Amycolatopsis carbonis TaxID=715471 RepID=A0A9Y2INU5_9PSEU|nr:hypothetical protein [Amycolatopsis sp. 2-15]WIX82774.1 hypothetical protein QRX50_19325 [Amycolatopsis sp. 2-15]